MAHVTINAFSNAGPAARLFRGPSVLLSNIAARIARYRLFRATLNEMQGLSERELVDLGLSRSMLRRAAYEAAYG